MQKQYNFEIGMCVSTINKVDIFSKTTGEKDSSTKVRSECSLRSHFGFANQASTAVKCKRVE